MKVQSQSWLFFEKTIKFLDVVFAADLEAGDQCTALCYPSLESLEAAGGGTQHEGVVEAIEHVALQLDSSPGAREGDQLPIKVTDKGNQSLTLMYGSSFSRYLFIAEIL